MKSDSSSLRAKRPRTVSRFQPYQSGDPKSPSSSSTPRTRSRAMTRDTSGSTNEDLSFYTAVDHIQSISGNDITKSDSVAPFSLPEVVSLTPQSASSSSPSRLTRQNAVILDTHGVVDCPAEPVGSHIPPGLKESIHKAIQHHVKKYAFQLEASLCNQIAVGLSEAIDFTLNIIERPFAETHPIQHSPRIVVPTATYSDSSSSLMHMPGAWKRSRSQL
ncbi:hypothetical protein PISMIDRAFT_17336 [Pisolithus microcarpus 441]|uniref:Uncharacterized protein n=1 Tax=Pisolithus microcarpus 441 TaxID=765257 RepID=A0A0C9YC77_9AGAM|nr:hypothetical protein PISMIDRAFT_19614 [Pisolithus microcarpus 441]KIK14361.1 hypothetical protein PISMIDRAFT_17336 [Pisolithus microcarpus 441]